MLATAAPALAKGADSVTLTYRGQTISSDMYDPGSNPMLVQRLADASDRASARCELCNL